VRMRYRSSATAASTSGRCTLMATSPPPSPASRPRYTCRMPDRVYSTLIKRSLETLAQGACPLDKTHWWRYALLCAAAGNKKGEATARRQVHERTTAAMQMIPYPMFCAHAIGTEGQTHLTQASRRHGLVRDLG